MPKRAFRSSFLTFLRCRLPLFFERFSGHALKSANVSLPFIVCLHWTQRFYSPALPQSKPPTFVPAGLLGGKRYRLYTSDDDHGEHQKCQ
jgi:hypothetical protein